MRTVRHISEVPDYILRRLLNFKVVEVRAYGCTTARTDSAERIRIIYENDRIQTWWRSLTEPGVWRAIAETPVAVPASERPLHDATNAPEGMPNKKMRAYHKKRLLHKLYRPIMGVVAEHAQTEAQKAAAAAAASSSTTVGRPMYDDGDEG